MSLSSAIPVTLRTVILGACLYLMGIASPAVAAPSLWVVKSPTATIYLFGTIHILPKDQRWETSAIKAALHQSQELWLEVSDFDNADTARTLVKQLGFDSTRPLSTVLPAKEFAQLSGAAARLNLPQGEATLDPMRPWLAAVTLEDVQLLRAGYDPNAGVEHILRDEWNATHKAVRGFETMDQQLHFLADLPPHVQEDFLESTLVEIDAGVPLVDALVAAWMRGDQQAISALIVDELRTPSPELYHTLFVARNEHWAGIIDGLLKKTGKRFIAVGAGHLVGPDSVQAKLSAKGIQVELVR